MAVRSWLNISMLSIHENMEIHVIKYLWCTDQDECDIKITFSVISWSQLDLVFFYMITEKGTS